MCELVRAIVLAVQQPNVSVDDAGRQGGAGGARLVVHTAHKLRELDSSCTLTAEEANRERQITKGERPFSTCISSSDQ